MAHKSGNSPGQELFLSRMALITGPVAKARSLFTAKRKPDACHNRYSVAASIVVMVLLACSAYRMLLPAELPAHSKREYFGVAPNADGDEFYALASNLALGKGYTLDGTTPHNFRAPGYPLMLSLWFRIAGVSPESVYQYQSFVHALSAGLAFLLFMEVYTFTPLSFLLSLGLTLLPPFITRVSHMLYEPTIMLFTTAALLASIMAMKKGDKILLIISGGLWGAATLTKVVAFFAVPLLALPLRSRRLALIAILAFMVVMLPWTIRNYTIYHKLIPVNSQSDYVLLAKDFDVYPGRIIRDIHSLAYRLVEEPLWNFLHFTFPDFYTNWYSSPLRPPVRMFRAVAYTWWVVLIMPLYLIFLSRVIQLLQGKLNKQLQFLVIFYLIYIAEHMVILGTPRFSTPVFPVLLCMFPAACIPKILR